MSVLIKLIILVNFSVTFCYAQDIVETLSSDISPPELKTLDDLITERILRISASRRIFVITNNNSILFKGDFFSIFFDTNLVARALVAKHSGDHNAIKIMKIYDLKRWETVKENMEIRILKGDDSFFRKGLDEKPKELIEDKDDLYNDTFLDEDIGLEERNNRIIKPDNIISAQYGKIGSINSSYNSQSYDHFSGSWAYQVADNIWAEFQFGQTTVNQFPAEDLSTDLNTYTGRLKFTIAGPWYSYFMPYAGFLKIAASSTGAGIETIDQETGKTNDPDEELNKLEEMEQDKIIFGVTILKRFVPGWFLRADVGNDIINFGLALEF